MAWIDTVQRDVRYALRVLRRQPIAAATAVLTLAIGIGLNAAVFSVTDWVLLRPLPYPSAHELVRVFTAGAEDITTLATAALLLAGVGIIAALLAAARVVSSDPATALRSE